MIHQITLPSQQAEIYREILRELNIFFLQNNQTTAARFSNQIEAQSVWELFREKIDKIFA
jgi:hypothetical protein